MLSIDEIKQILEQECLVYEGDWYEGTSTCGYEYTFYFSKYTYIKTYEDDSYIEPEGTTDYYLHNGDKNIPLTHYEMQLIVRYIGLFKLCISTCGYDFYSKFKKIVVIIEKEVL